MDTFSPAIRLFVVDDHPVVRMGISSVFDHEADISVVGLAGSGDEALAAIPALHVDVVLIDMRMKGMDGDVLAGELHRTQPGIRTAVLSNFHSDEEVFRAIRAGVRAFLLKSAPMEEIIGAVRLVHAGERWIPPHIATQLAARLARHQLSPREIQILELIAEGLSNRQIGDRLNITENTVRNHMNNVLDKLESRDRTEAITKALRRGIVRLDED